MAHWSSRLPRVACKGAVEWARTQPSPQAAWDRCERGDWMAWLLGYYAGEPGSEARKPLVLCLCECASLARRYTSGATRVAFDRCQRTARSWAQNRGATLDDVEVADADADAYAAYAAAYAAATAYAAAAYAAYAAARADADAAADGVALKRARSLRSNRQEALPAAAEAATQGEAEVMDAMKCHVCGAQSTIEHAPHCSFRGLPEHRRIAKLERDQADWRKGWSIEEACEISALLGLKFI